VTKVYELGYDFADGIKPESLDGLIELVCENGMFRLINPKKFLKKGDVCRCKFCYKSNMPKEPKVSGPVSLDIFANEMGVTIVKTLEDKRIETKTICDQTRKFNLRKHANYISCNCHVCMKERMSRIRSTENLDIVGMLKPALNWSLENYLTPKDQVDASYELRPYYRGFVAPLVRKSRYRKYHPIEIIRFIDYQKLSQLANQRNGLTLDHIIPVSFGSKCDIRLIALIWNANNLRLLSANENVSKGNSFRNEDLEFIAKDDFLFALFALLVTKEYDVDQVLNALFPKYQSCEIRLEQLAS
ncbi:MAG: hypothetical protein ACRCXZ_03190, partial [Patescibacteria group bacterium]